MQQAIKPSRSQSPRREPSPAIPQFRKIGLSAVAAACVWERRPVTPRRDPDERKPGPRNDNE
jgi:hypothetical protein